MSDQLEMDIPAEESNEEWHSETVKRLKEYRSLKLAVEGADLHDDPKALSAIEKKRKDVQLIELALSPLSPQARKIIELSYFTWNKQKDVYIRRQIGMAHTCFYETKNEVMLHIAKVLNIL